MATMIKALLDLVSPAIKSILDVYKGDLQVVKAWENLGNVLSPHPELLRKHYCVPQLVGIHPLNRGGMGVVLATACTNASKHIDA